MTAAELDAGAAVTALPSPSVPAPLAAPVSRRRFLVGAAASGGLLVGAPFITTLKRAAAAGVPTTTMVTAWIQIGSDNSITILIGASEMGQGVLTGLPQIVAEELRVDWATVTTAHAVATTADTATTSNPYDNPIFASQATGGSTSTAAYFAPMQQAGAAARVLLEQAAANLWGVPVAQCVANRGVVTCAGPPARTATYGQLAAAAALLPPPVAPPLTPPSQWTLIGTSAPRKDIPAKTTGAAIYGIDVRLPNMVYAAIVHCPSLGGTVGAITSPPAGAIAVVNLGNAVAVVADSTWHAMTMARALKVTWVAPANAKQMNDQTISSVANQLMAKGPATAVEGSSAALAAIAAAPKKLTATYSVPYVPHACMEVLNATALVATDGQSCQIWAPTQSQSLCQIEAAAVLGVDLNANPRAVTVHTTFLGGGLGRKGEVDYVVEAVRIAKALPGRPVHLTWSREQDFGHDLWRPMGLMRIEAGLSSTNTVTGWANRIVSPSILGQKGWIGPGSEDPSMADGAMGLAYGLGSRLVETVVHPSPVPVSFWRSVGNSINAFSVESAVDELAVLAGVDPLVFRQKLLAAGAPSLDRTRLQGVLSAVQTLSGWTTPPPAGVGRGVALGKAMNTYVAEVAEVTTSAKGTMVVTSVWCAVDCGVVVNPDNVVAQMQGGIMHGLNAARHGGSHFAGGVASPVNFDEYRMLRMADAPVITVTIVPSTEPSSGVGEPGVPYIAPAVANAWYNLTGARKRSLPLG